MNNCDLCAQAPAIRIFTTHKEVVHIVDRRWKVCMVCAVFVDTKNRSALFTRVKDRYVDTRAAIRAVASFFQTLVKKEEASV